MRVKRLPFVVGHGPGEGRVAAGDEGVVVEIAQRGGVLRKFLVVVVDDERLCLGERQSLAHHGRKLAVADHDPGFGVVELEGNDGRVETRVHGQQHGPGHRHPVVGLQHRRGVGEHGGHGIAAADAACRQRRGELSAARIEGAVGEA